MNTQSPFFDQSATTDTLDDFYAKDRYKKTPPESMYAGKVVPVTLFTGYLGAGKTTVITNLIKSMPPTYKIAWLKNEIGNTAIDSELARQTNVATVKEILKGCLCHYMLGSLNAALEEILQSKPDRIVIETSGSAAPAPIVWEIRKNPHLLMDGVITIIDAVNFSGYVNKSAALKMQAKYTDLILINKHEELDERTLDQHLDDLYEINLDTPKIKTDHGKIDPNIVFGLDSTLFMTEESVTKDISPISQDHQDHEVELIEITPEHIFDHRSLPEILQKFPKKNFYRIKGIVHTNDNMMTIINYAFGGVTFTTITSKTEPRVVFMGEDLIMHKDLITEVFHISQKNLHFSPRDHHEHAG